MRHCVHPDCIYHAGPDDYNNCNYAMLTGKTRLGQLPKERHSPHLCTLYVPGERLLIPDPIYFKNYSTSKLDNILARELHARGMPEKEIAAALGCSVRTIRMLKRKDYLENDR